MFDVGIIFRYKNKVNNILPQILNTQIIHFPEIYFINSFHFPEIRYSNIRYQTTKLLLLSKFKRIGQRGYYPI